MARLCEARHFYIIMKIRLFVFPVLFCFLLSACNNSPKVRTYADAEREFLASLTAEDSLAVVDLAKEFFENVKYNKTDEALDMINVLENAVLYRIDLASRDFLRPRFLRMPEEGWSLVRYSFSTPGVNDLVCMYGGMKLVFNPVKIDGRWYLTLKDGFQPSADLSKGINPNSPAPKALRLNKKEFA